MIEALIVIALFSPLFIAVIVAYQKTDWLEPFMREVWNQIVLMYSGSLGQLHKKPEPYDPPPIMWLYEDQLDEKADKLVAERTKNPRLVKESLARQEWQAKFNQLKKKTRNTIGPVPIRRYPADELFLAEDEEDEFSLTQTENEWLDSWIIKKGKNDHRTKKCEHGPGQICYYCERNTR